MGLFPDPGDQIGGLVLQPRGEAFAWEEQGPIHPSTSPYIKSISSLSPLECLCDRASLYSSGEPQIHYVAQAGLELEAILLPTSMLALSHTQSLLKWSAIISLFIQTPTLSLDHL